MVQVMVHTAIVHGNITVVVNIVENMPVLIVVKVHIPMGIIRQPHNTTHIVQLNTLLAVIVLHVHPMLAQHHMLTTAFHMDRGLTTVVPNIAVPCIAHPAATVPMSMQAIR